MNIMNQKQPKVIYEITPSEDANDSIWPYMQEITISFKYPDDIVDLDRFKFYAKEMIEQYYYNDYNVKEINVQK